MRGKLSALLAALGFVYLLVMAAVGGPMQQAQFVAFEAEGVLAAGARVAATDRAAEQQAQLQALTHQFVQHAAAMALVAKSRGA